MKKILIVDDEEDIVDTLTFALEIKGFECITAFDGMEGLNKAKNEKPDLILLDLMLPKMEGYKVCRLLKFDDKYKHIPIIMLTAKTLERDKLVGKETGADEYMTKPFELDNLIKTICKYLSIES